MPDQTEPCKLFKEESILGTNVGVGLIKGGGDSDVRVSISIYFEGGHAWLALPPGTARSVAASLIEFADLIE